MVAVIPNDFIDHISNVKYVLVYYGYHDDRIS